MGMVNLSNQIGVNELVNTLQEWEIPLCCKWYNYRDKVGFLINFPSSSFTEFQSQKQLALRG